MTDSPRRARALAWTLAAVLCAISTPALAAGSGAASFAGFYAQAVARQADGKLLVAGGAIHRAGGFDFAVARLNADDSADTSFNATGFARLPVWGDLEWASFVAVDSDGKVVIGGMAQDPATCSCPFASCGYYPCRSKPAVTRLNADGTVDRSFNDGAPLVLALDYLGAGYVTSDDIAFEGFEMQSDDGIVLLGSIPLDDDRWTPPSPMARVNRDGTLDGSFAAGLVAPHLMQFAPVIEYYNPALDHYFMTSLRSEFAALDEGTFGDWRRTHRAFHAWSTGSMKGRPVCRLYGAASAGINSHRFFIDPDDCRAQAADDGWTLESPEVFRAEPPVSNAGDCSAGEVPVYRLSNPRRDVNYRFTTDAGIFGEMVAEGFTPDGSGPRGVFICVPA